MILMSSVSFACLLSLAGLSTIICDIDESKPDLGMFRLRPVDGSQQTQDRLTQPIKSYASGAIAMRRALFSSDSQVRCSAYAHLLKLIHNANSAGSKELKQDSVMALAITVDNDRQRYGELFKMYEPVVLQETFKQAIEELERRHVVTPVSSDTWMELIDCAVQFELNLDSFVQMPARAAKIDAYRKFKALESSAIEREPSSRAFSEQEILEARLKVESFDNAEMKEVRNVLRDPKDQIPQPEELPMPENDSHDDRDAPEEDGPAAPIDIEVPVVDETEIKFDVAEPKAIEERFDVLSFLRRRVEILEKTPKELIAKKSKLTLDSAVDFVNVWNRLTRLNLDPSDPLAVRVAKFLNEERNVRIFNRLSGIIENFKQIEAYGEKLKKNGGKWKSMDELEETYAGLMKVLGEVDYLIDIYDFSRAALNNRAKMLKEFQTMNKFIQADFW